MGEYEVHALHVGSDLDNALARLRRWRYCRILTFQKEERNNLLNNVDLPHNQDILEVEIYLPNGTHLVAADLHIQKLRRLPDVGCHQLAAQKYFDPMVRLG
jgi:hypothetical protein